MRAGNRQHATDRDNRQYRQHIIHHIRQESLRHRRHDVLDKQGEIHSGITRCPIPILGASPETIKEVRERLRSFDAKDMVLVDFSTVAQQAKTYEEYEQGMRETDEADLCYMGIGI